MAHWGAALAAGPHINDMRLPPEMAELASNELTFAQRAGHASAVERALIDALSHRYAEPEPHDRTPLVQAYADAMREVWRKYPNDADVGAFFAESMMELRPWAKWTLDGDPNPDTEEIIATVLSKSVDAARDLTSSAGELKDEAGGLAVLVGTFQLAPLAAGRRPRRRSTG